MLDCALILDVEFLSDGFAVDDQDDVVIDLVDFVSDSYVDCDVDGFEVLIVHDVAMLAFAHHDDDPVDGPIYDPFADLVDDHFDANDVVDDDVYDDVVKCWCRCKIVNRSGDTAVDVDDDAVEC